MSCGRSIFPMIRITYTTATEQLIRRFHVPCLTLPDAVSSRKLPIPFLSRVWCLRPLMCSCFLPRVLRRPVDDLAFDIRERGARIIARGAGSFQLPTAPFFCDVGEIRRCLCCAPVRLSPNQIALPLIVFLSSQGYAFFPLSISYSLLGLTAVMTSSTWNVTF